MEVDEHGRPVVGPGAGQVAGPGSEVFSLFK